MYLQNAEGCRDFQSGMSGHMHGLLTDNRTIPAKYRNAWSASMMWLSIVVKSGEAPTSMTHHCPLHTHRSSPHLSLQQHLGYFNHIFRLSQLHQCDQEMLPNRFLESSLRSSFLSYIVSFSEGLFGYIPGISSHSHATKELSEADL